MGAGVGITKDMPDRVYALQQVGVYVICLDSAHRHTKGVIDALKKTKKDFKNLQVIAGNIATGRWGKGLVEAGADAVKLGIGPGSICTTRIVAGGGDPDNCAYGGCLALKEYRTGIIGDGGTGIPEIL